MKWENAGTDAATPTLNLWAPTATSVHARLWETEAAEGEGTLHPMTLNPDTGIWTVTGQADWKNKAYKFEVQVYVPSTGQIGGSGLRAQHRSD